ncbi:XkdX family protein [Bacillus sp. IT-79MI2]|nr:hypothetical protein BTH41_04838 [Bacillus mycoides]
MKRYYSSKKLAFAKILGLDEDSYEQFIIFGRKLNYDKEVYNNG